MPQEEARPRALFVGLCTLDIIQLVDHVPAANEKLTAQRQTIAAGGPATNAAATYSHMGGAATLLTGIGSHPLARGVTADLSNLSVRAIDLDGASAEPPPVSTILVTAGTGERAVASTNAVGRNLSAPQNLDALVAEVEAVEVDGHHISLAVAAARSARSLGRLTVFDGGSWKENTQELLRWIDVAVCSADFRPPGLSTPEETLTFLRSAGVTWAAVSRGSAPLLWAGPDAHGEVEIAKVGVADTLGAGDVLHGALTYYLSQGHAVDAHAFARALGLAAGVASRSCSAFGTRAWMVTQDRQSAPR